MTHRLVNLFWSYMALKHKADLNILRENTSICNVLQSKVYKVLVQELWPEEDSKTISFDVQQKN